MSLTNLNECYDGYATTSIPDENSKINHYTLDEIKKKYKIKTFNVLVADCEGFLEQFIDENPNIQHTPSSTDLEGGLKLDTIDLSKLKGEEHKKAESPK